MYHHWGISVADKRYQIGEKAIKGKKAVCKKT
jgi:hypothetical protein